VSERRTDDAKLIEAVRVLSRTIQTYDGVIGACMAEAALRLEELVEDRRWVPVGGDIIDMEYSGELGVYYGTIRCQACDQDAIVYPMADAPKCRCGFRWYFSVSAVGELPPGPDAEKPELPTG